MINQCLIPVLLIGLATWQAVETFHHGSLFRFVREWATADENETFTGQLIRCPFCLSHWVAAVLLIVWCLVPQVIYWLAVIRIAQLGNDLTHHFCRSPTREEELVEIPVQLIEEPNEKTDLSTRL